MTLVRWSPLGLTRSRDSLHEDVDRLFDSFFSPGSRSDQISSFTPAVDVEENTEEIIVRADLPGISLQDVKVQLTGEVLSIRGERRVAKDDKKGNVYRSERIHGTFERSFTLTVPVRADQVHATYRDGVLEVRIPKAEEARVRDIQVQSS